MSSAEDCEIVDADGDEVTFQDGDILTVKGGLLDMGHAGLVMVKDGEVVVLEVNTDEQSWDPQDVHVQTTPICEFLERYEEAGRSVHRSRPKKPDGMTDEEWETAREQAVSFFEDKVCDRYTLAEYLVNAVYDVPGVWYCSEIIVEAFREQGVDLGFPGGPGVPSPFCEDPVCTDVLVDYSNLSISSFSSSDMNPWGWALSLGGLRDDAESAAEQKVQNKVGKLERTLEKKYGNECKPNCGCISKSYSTTFHWSQSVSKWVSVGGDWVKISFDLDVDIKITYRIGLCVNPSKLGDLAQEIQEVLQRLVKALEDGEVSIEELADALEKSSPDGLRESDAVEPPDEIRRKSSASAGGDGADDAGDGSAVGTGSSSAGTGPSSADSGRRLDDVEGIGEDMAARLAERGVVTVDDLAAVDPDSLDVPGVSRERLARWRTNAELLRDLPGITGNDAEVMATAGITDPDAVAERSPEALREAFSTALQRTDVPADYSLVQLLDRLGVDG